MIKVSLIYIIIFAGLCFGRDEYSIVQSDSNLVIEFYNSALEYSGNEDYQRATSDLMKGIKLLESQKLYLDSASKYQLMKYYRVLARNFRKLKKFRESESYFNKALEIGTKEFPDSLQTIRTHIGIGRLHFAVSAFEEANKSYSLALKMLKNHPDFLTSDRIQRNVSTVNNDLGRLYYRQSLYKLAEEHYQEALNLELNSVEIDTLYTSLLYNNLGNVAHEIGDFDKSLEFYDRSLMIKNRLQKDYNSVFRTICNKGRVFIDKGQYDKALQILKKAHNELLQYKKRDTVMIAWNYNNIGNALKNAGRYKEAILNYEKSKKLYKNIFGIRHYMIVKELLNIGDCYFQLGDHIKAKTIYKESLEISKDIFGDVHSDVAAAYYKIGKIHESENRLFKALKKYNQAVLAIRYNYLDYSVENVIDARFYLKLLEEKSDLLTKMYKKSGDLQKLFAAHRHYEVAFKIFDKMQIGFKNDGSKYILARNTSKMYGKAVKIAFELYQKTNNAEFKNSAYQFAEKNKSNTLLQKLYLSDARKFSSIPEELINIEDSLKIKLTILDTELKLLKSNKFSFGVERVDQLEKSYFVLKESLENLRKKFEKEYPNYYDLKYQNRTIDLHEIRLKLNENTALIQYLLTDDEIYIFILSDKNLDIVSVRKEKKLINEINQLLDGISKRSYAEYTSAAISLYNQLFSPVEKYVSRKKNIVIIPDGEIGSIPFGALITNYEKNTKSHNYHKLNYLIKKYNISYHLSTNLLFADFNDKKSFPKYDFLGIAPQFLLEEQKKEDVKILQSGFSPLGDGRNQPIPLPYALDEVKEIKSIFDSSYEYGKWFKTLFNKNYSMIFSGATASEESFKEFNYSDYKYLHFATHCILDKEIPELSGLILSSGNGKEDGVLYLNEIYNLKLNAELVTLSACETARGKWIDGEGVIGLTRGFIYAGAKNLLVSFWKVNDYSTSQFMKSYYSKMIQGHSKAASLRETKLEMIRSGYDLALPYYWASFKLIGKSS